MVGNLLFLALFEMNVCERRKKIRNGDFLTFWGVSLFVKRALIYERIGLKRAMCYFSRTSKKMNSNANLVKTCFFHRITNGRNLCGELTQKNMFLTLIYSFFMFASY